MAIKDRRKAQFSCKARGTVRRRGEREVVEIFLWIQKMEEGEVAQTVNI